MLALINRETENAKNGGEGKIIIKLNSLVDPIIISALYEASNTGVKIDLIVRGICCLIPQKKGLSENIKVISIVGRFLEHSRIFYFFNNGSEEVYLSSADMMQRNLDRRVETSFPIENLKARNEIQKTILRFYLKDNVKARELHPDMSYTFRECSDKSKQVDSQEWLMNHAIKSCGKFSKPKVG